MSDNQGSGMFGGLIVGGLIGAGLALLLAPASGRETRRRLRGRFDDLKETAVDRVGEATSSIRKGVRHLGDAVKEGTEAFRRSELDTTTKGRERS